MGPHRNPSGTDEKLLAQVSSPSLEMAGVCMSKDPKRDMMVSDKSGRVADIGGFDQGKPRPTSNCAKEAEIGSHRKSLGRGML